MKTKKTSALNLITPAMIQTKETWWETFQHCETEISARLFVRACQRAERWTVSKAELDAEDSSGDFWFNGLDEEWIIHNPDGTFTPTHKFVAHCFEHQPS